MKQEKTSHQLVTDQQEGRDPDASSDPNAEPDQAPRDDRPLEYGGPRGKEPTRYGDWEKNGRCIDF